MKFGISQSPLTNNIYVGRLNKKGNEYLEKKDMTMEAIMSAIRHIEQNIKTEGNNTVNITSTTDNVRYELTLSIVDLKEELEK